MYVNGVLCFFFVCVLMGFFVFLYCVCVNGVLFFIVCVNGVLCFFFIVCVLMGFFVFSLLCVCLWGSQQFLVTWLQQSSILTFKVLPH